eukprot:Rhum_TRINITY_DN14503_c10_g1::Rhum_TRINITY_DN14503_c10_g1_i1::g.95695::m.95695
MAPQSLLWLSFCALLAAAAASCSEGHQIDGSCYFDEKKQKAVKCQCPWQNCVVETEDTDDGVFLNNVTTTAKCKLTTEAHVVYGLFLACVGLIGLSCAWCCCCKGQGCTATAPCRGGFCCQGRAYRPAEVVVVEQVPAYTQQPGYGTAAVHTVNTGHAAPQTHGYPEPPVYER